MGGLHARGVSRIRQPAAQKDSRHLSRQSPLVKLLLTWLCPEEKEFLHLGRMPPVARAEAVAMANMARDERGQVNHSATRGSCRGVSGASLRRFGLELMSSRTRQFQGSHPSSVPQRADIQAGSTITTWLANTCWDLQHEGETHPRRASSRHRRVLATQSDEVELSHDGRRRDGEQMEDSEEQGTRGHQHRAPRRQNHGADRRGGSKCPSEQGGGSGRRLGAELARPPEALSAKRPCRQRGLVSRALAGCRVTRPCRRSLACSSADACHPVAVWVSVKLEGPGCILSTQCRGRAANGSPPTKQRARLSFVDSRSPRQEMADDGLGEPSVSIEVGHLS